MEKVGDVAASNNNVKKIMRNAKNRIVRLENDFWNDFRRFLLTEVKESYRSNGMPIALCCWTLLRRKAGFYLEHAVIVSLSKILKYEEEAWELFLELAKQNGWRDNECMAIPYLDLEHLDAKDEPSYHDHDAGRFCLSVDSHIDIYSSKSLPDSTRPELGSPSRNSTS